LIHRLVQHEQAASLHHGDVVGQPLVPDPLAVRGEELEGPGGDGLGASSVRPRAGSGSVARRTLSAEGAVPGTWPPMRRWASSVSNCPTGSCPRCRRCAPRTRSRRAGAARPAARRPGPSARRPGT
jgi:hypothetical protein